MEVSNEDEGREREGGRCTLLDLVCPRNQSMKQASC